VFVVMRHDASEDDLARVVDRIEELGFASHVSKGEERTVVGVKGPRDRINPDAFAGLSGVLHVVRVSAPHKLASREWRPESSVVDVGGEAGGVKIGPGALTFIAGPCAVEGEDILREAAAAVKSNGAHMLRGGAFKPRTSPYDFQGLGREGVRMLVEAGREVGLPVVTEARAAAHVEIIAELAGDHAHMIQIGARNMQNYDLLREAGRAKAPVLLKRGISARTTELLMSAEYILSEGNEDVVLCERGIRTFENSTRFTLDVSAVPVLKSETHLPVIVDPSHAAGKAGYVAALARAGIAAGADGIIVEVHPRPSGALCDAAQALTPEAFGRLVGELKGIGGVLGETGAASEVAAGRGRGVGTK
jgi:3-deoxy-7-phosphoheptulonate synthase